jgi:4-carboxymuconolactone decarboxylase
MTALHPNRLRPLPADQWDDDVRRALSPLLAPERANPHDAGNVLATLARHPELAHAYLTFNAYLLRDSTLSARVREVALLRVVHRRECGYLWSHHVPIARRTGLSAAEIQAISDGEAADELDGLVLRAVDELDEQSTISDVTWTALSGHFDDRQRMDLVFTIGGYGLLAQAVNTLGIEGEGT